MAALYAQLLQPDRNLRASFLRILVRCFETASDLLSPGAAAADPRYAVMPACNPPLYAGPEVRLYWQWYTHGCMLSMVLFLWFSHCKLHISKAAACVHLQKR